MSLRKKFFISACDEWIIQTICYNGLFFLCKGKKSEWGSSDFTNLLVLKLLIQTRSKIEKSERSSLKEREWLMVREPSKYSFCFCAIGRRCQIKRGLGNVMALTGRAKRHWQRVYHTKKRASGVSAAALSPERAHLPSCQNKLVDKNCHWLCFIFLVLVSGCIPSASHVNWGLLPDLGDQFSVKKSWLMDHCVAAPALKITANTVSNSLLNYMLDLQRGACRWILAAHQAVCLTKPIKWSCGLGCSPSQRQRVSGFIAWILEPSGWICTSTCCLPALWCWDNYSTFLF